jgi:hypothetical protein
MILVLAPNYGRSGFEEPMTGPEHRFPESRSCGSNAREANAVTPYRLVANNPSPTACVWCGEAFIWANVMRVDRRAGTHSEVF